MQNTWQLQEAKNKLSQVIREAKKGAPQIITQHGLETAVVISIEKYRKSKQPNQTLVQFFQTSPLKGLPINLKRRKDRSREVRFGLSD
jgi:prevent-host-death family protein